ncbi:MAG TPA: tRNA (adenosine(37)-N6)-threonylcarbamoyltransferase complex dimerization subunit type 1 TsaB [Verrucomicrobiae bacterium]|nr:tRNA (adenosine(37)-N6)-threonylcarbamoyltransferase complex dimerization subunit type 1 TsaB [Verrucomicrobiae bacterium]
MTVLALEFSSARRSAAVLDLKQGGVSPLPENDGAPAIPRPPARMAEAIETGTGGTNAFSLIGKALAGAELTREQIEVIVVGLGPGSYTGIRVALAMAQGWQLARGVKLLGISSAEGLVAQAQAEKMFGRVQVVIDAQRNEFYLASYEISPGGWKEIQPLRIVPLAEMQSQASAGGIWVGPEVTRWLSKGRSLFPSAMTLGRLAVGREDFVRGDKLAPIYLREISFVKASPPNPLAF